MHTTTRKTLLGALAALALLPLHAEEASDKTAVFPGDLGRPFNGLPLPDGPSRRPPWPTKPQPARTPSMDVALQLARAVVDACKGYHVGVSIIDAAATPKLYYIPDGTAGFHAYTAFRKANTALRFKLPTSEVGTLSKTDAKVAATITADSSLLSFPGGVPITVGNEIVGAIGVSGAEPSAIDEKCAQAGLAGISALLK
jgi:uncharacterized protein GlcG (DUF336 family)